MKKILLWGYFLLLMMFSPVYASGGITHMFIAAQTLSSLPDPRLKQLLENNLDAYLVGAVYPDSGYIHGANYGEDSHWDAFIYTFADYLKTRYADPIQQNPRLVAFLFGCASHRVVDESAHWVFYKAMRDHDFPRDMDTAHSYGDLGIDVLLNIEKNQWFKAPTNWWVPVNDLVKIYQRMGKAYSAREIIWGNSVLAAAPVGERMIAAPAYPYMKWKMPWTAANYFLWPAGGILMDEHQVTNYQIKLWQFIISKSQDKNLTRNSYHNENKNHAEFDIATKALQANIIRVNTTVNPDGSVTISQPIVTQLTQLRALVNKLLAKLTS